MDPPTKIKRKNCKISSRARPSKSKKHETSTTNARIYDESDEQQTPTYISRGNMIGVSKLYFMISENDEIKRCVDKTGWTQFLFKNVVSSDYKFVPALVKRWSPRTHTFQLPEAELGITPYDFTTLTGIAVGMGTKLPQYSDSLFRDYSATINSYFPGFNQFQANYEIGVTLRISRLNDYIARIYNGGNILVSVQVISRAFCMYMLGYLFFPNGSATIGIGWLNYLVDMDKVGTYDWGTAILARIYLGLNRCKQEGVNSVYCFWQLIQYYLFEYLSTSCFELVDPSDQSWPRMLRWRKDNRTSTPGSIRLSVLAAEKQLELGSPQSIQWKTFLPFRDKFPYVSEAYNVSVTRHMLLDPQRGAVYYLGERCLRQLTGVIAIPVDPPTPMTYTDLAPYLQVLRMNTEELRYDKLSRQASQCEYDAYYSSVVRRWAPLQCAVNSDVVYNVASHMPEIISPTFPTPAAKFVEYHNQSSRSGRSIASIDTLRSDWMIPSLESSGNVTMLPVPRPANSFEAPSATSYSRRQWRKVYVEYVDYSSSLWQTIVDTEHQLRHQTLQMEQKDIVIKERDAEITRLQHAQNPS